MLRFILAGILATAGLVLAVISLVKGNPVVALALTLAAIYVGLGILLGVAESMINPHFQIAAAVIGLVGIAGVFLYNRAFDFNIQDAHAAAVSEFVTMELRCRPMSIELQNIQEFGMKACATQGNSDQMTAVLELAKGVHFGPTLTIVDSAASLQKSPSPDYCAQAFKAASDLCPSAFLSLSNANREALIKAAK